MDKIKKLKKIKDSQNFNFDIEVDGGINFDNSKLVIEAGANILRAGGNAVDAALACAFVQTVVDPMMCGIAGFGSMHLYLPEAGVHECIDFHGRVPASATGRTVCWGRLRTALVLYLKAH